MRGRQKKKMRVAKSRRTIENRKHTLPSERSAADFAKVAVCKSLPDLYILAREIGKSLGKICIPSEEIHISLTKICKSGREICISSEEIHRPKIWSWSKRRQRTRSVSEGQHRGSRGSDAKAEEVALAYASGSLPPFRP